MQLFSQPMQRILLYGILFFRGGLMCPIHTNGSTISYESLSSLRSLKNPFSYDLHTTLYKGASDHEPVMIVCHGYGDNYCLAQYLHIAKVTRRHLVGFNFPDHDISHLDDHANSSYGTFQEILPVLYLIKSCVIDLNLSAVSLYGFSAGGGAVVNVLAALYTDRWDHELEDWGITLTDKTRMGMALEEGIVILDCPLKSIEEVMDFREEVLSLKHLPSTLNGTE